jgi:NAD(P)-dependent dehydrogenase (short-subunit alcohol dehydrogenase family)
MDKHDPDESRRLAGKRVLVTGAGTGIGREIALEAARQGADVALHYVHEAEGALSAVAAIQEAGRRAVALPADFTRLEAAQEMTRQAIDFLGGLDALVNNAGITMNRPFDAVTPEQFDTLYAVNVRATLIETHGSVVNLASIHAFQGSPQHSVYAGTKGAMVAFTREIGIELALRGVRVNAIAPGAVVVENYYRADPGYDPERAGTQIPCGFAGLPTDIAKVATFLLCDEARYIVGQTLIVDGGTTSWMPFSDAFRQPMTTQFGKGYVPGLD